MRYTTLRVLALLTVVSMQLLANDIEPGKEFYNATMFPKPPKIDGDLSDWAGVPVISDPMFWVPKGLVQPGKYVIFEPYNGGLWTGPDDWTSAFQIGWDANNLYIGVTVTDDSHESLATSPTSAWNGDSVQLMIADAARSQQLALYNYGLGGEDGALGDIYIHNENGAPGQPAPADDPACNCATEAFIKRDTAKKKTYYEIRLPAGAMGFTAPLTNGMKIGLGVCINNGDVTEPGQPDQTGQKGWGGWGTHSIVFGKTPSETGLLTLTTNLPTVERAFIGDINPRIDSFSFRATDRGTSIVTSNGATLTLDGQSVPLTATSSTAGDAINFNYKAPAPLPPGSSHSYAILVKDTSGNSITATGNFTTENYILLNVPTVTADTSKTGFLFEMSQVANIGSEVQNSIRRAQDQLYGLLGPNIADPAAQGAALGAGKVNANANLPIDFEIGTVINLSASGNTGDFPPGDPMPGSPGTGGGTDNQAARIITYVDLPAGLATMGVNSDDNFLTGAGAWNDAFNSQTLGQFDAPGGRGVADTTFSFYVPKAGVYPFFTIWENGGGGSDVTWFSVKADGTKVLLNDSTNGGFKAYRAITSAPQNVAAARTVLPAPGDTAALPDRILVVLADGATPIDKSTVSLKVDNTVVAASISKTGSVTTVSYSPVPFFASNSSHSAELDYTENGSPVARKWSFTIANLPMLTPDMAVKPDTTKPGFIWRMSQVDSVGSDTQTSNKRTEDQLAGKLGPNTADPSAVGVAVGPGKPDTNPNLPITFEIPTVIALDRNGASWGNWTGGQMPGSPGINGGTDNQAAEILTYVQLPAGIINMGVNSDDGFLSEAGPFSNPAQITLGAFDAGRAAADTIYTFVVQQAGTYSFRTTWENGGGDSRIAWFTVKSDGTQVLLNDTANGGFPAYRAATASAPPSAPKLAISQAAGKVTLTFDGTLQGADVVTGPWTDVSGTSPMTVTPSGGMKFYRAKR